MRFELGCALLLTSVAFYLNAFVFWDLLFSGLGNAYFFTGVSLCLKNTNVKSISCQFIGLLFVLAVPYPSGRLIGLILQGIGLCWYLYYLLSVVLIRTFFFWSLFLIKCIWRFMRDWATSICIFVYKRAALC
jgi:hypothetical protein